MTCASLLMWYLTIAQHEVEGLVQRLGHRLLAFVVVYDDAIERLEAPEALVHKVDEVPAQADRVERDI